MKRDALRTLVCPISRSDLKVIAFEETKLDLRPADVARCRALGMDAGWVEGSIKDGVLFSDVSRKWFPIVNHVPVLLDFPTDINRVFQERYRSASDIFSRYEPPNGEPRPGEEYVQRSFTKEWDLFRPDDPLSFGLTSEQRDEFIKLELDWPPGLLERRPLEILEVGCGSGFETLSLERVAGGRVTAFDLNLALIRKGHILARSPFITTAVASLFKLPLRPATFDIVYSSGVLHHTHSTKAAFDAIFEFRKPHGFIYIWVYAHEDVDYSIAARIDWIEEAITRPRIARLPDFWQDMVVKFKAWRHFRMYRRIGKYNKEKWTLTDSEHFVRDRWTALYAHRHSFHEVITWFLEKNLDYRLVNPKLYFDCMQVPLIGIGIRGMPAPRGP